MLVTFKRSREREGEANSRSRIHHPQKKLTTVEMVFVLGLNSVRMLSEAIRSRVALYPPK